MFSTAMINTSVYNVSTNFIIYNVYFTKNFLFNKFCIGDACIMRINVCVHH
jgi:hypothetical protein